MREKSIYDVIKRCPPRQYKKLARIRGIWMTLSTPLFVSQCSHSQRTLLNPLLECTNPPAAIIELNTRRYVSCRACRYTCFIFRKTKSIMFKNSTINPIFTPMGYYHKYKTQMQNICKFSNLIYIYLIFSSLISYTRILNTVLYKETTDNISQFYY